jgi:hypothetical protein
MELWNPDYLQSALPTEMIVWLWSAGDQWSGVASSRAAAMEHAEAHMTGEGRGLVEHAMLSSGIHGTRHTRTGLSWTARQEGDRVRWTALSEGEAQA